MSLISPFVSALFLLGVSLPAEASQPTINFDHFLKNYLVQSADSLSARRNLSAAERLKIQATDQWQSRLTATEDLNFKNQNFDSNARPNNSNSSNSISGQFTQKMPSGTSLEINGQKYIKTQNPLFNATDRSYSAKITQDLIKNSFGKSQRAQSNQGKANYEVAELEYLQAMAKTCETAFTLYADAYVQQEIAQLLKVQLRDAEKALSISRRLFQDRLINQVDRLTSESDFIDTKLQVEQAEQKLINTKMQIQAFMAQPTPLDFLLQDPSSYVDKIKITSRTTTLAEEILNHRLQGQDFAVEKARSDRWTDLQVGVEGGETYGRLAFGGPLVDYREQYLRANLTVGLDIVNNSENADLKNAVFQKNSLEKEKYTLGKTQRSKIDSLTAMNDLLAQQVKSSEKQVKLLEQKMKIAFNQMKTAKLDFQNYLLHRNAYLNQQRTFLNLKKDLWLNQFSLQKEYAHQVPELCEVSS